MDLSTADLRLVIAIAEEGSFSRAAARLHMSQPSVSARVGTIESKLSVQLFSRERRGARPTTAAHQIVPYARRCLALLSEASRVARLDPTDGRLRIVGHANYMDSALETVLDALDGVNVAVECSDIHTEDVVRALEDGAADIGFMLPTPHSPSIAMEPFRSDPVVTVVAPDHPLADHGPLRLSDLADSAVAVTKWGDGYERFVEDLTLAGIPRHRITLVSPATAATALARHHGHVAVAPRSACAAELDSELLTPLDVVNLSTWTIPVAVAYRIAEQHDSPLRTVLDAIKRANGYGAAGIARKPTE